MELREIAEELEELPGPYELLDLMDNQTIEFRVTNWSQGTIKIHPRYPGAPAEKTIPVMRLRVPFQDKPTGVQYYDVTSKTLQAQLLPMLMNSRYMDYVYRITKHGVRPRARFSLSRRPRE